MATFQVIISKQSAKELSKLSKSLQLSILADFHSLPTDFNKLDTDKFGKLVRHDRILYRYRTKDYRIYFEKTDHGILVHRILHKNTLKDFMFRSNLVQAEEEALQSNPEFWKLIDDVNQNSSSTKT
jgi:mRNA-degrading endonuclease RelE of RelBE toxin-antitoxin system